MRYKITRPNILSEIRKEFSRQYIKISSGLVFFFSRNPKVVFASMVVLLAASLILCFTVLRVRSEKSKAKSVLKPLTGAGVNVGLSIGNLQKMLSLQQELEAILKKDTLGAADSVAFRRIMKEVESMRSH
ncbi:hypothetical protein ACS5PU_16610 [Pedobacter sp. GSP4]|uniref:hypothetical protein n=1 Tax=Pedobacter sp. GSP4 TaxID=3453716 RepID=UPI003EEC5B2D